MCSGPQVQKPPEHGRKIGEALRRYWRSPAGRARRRELQEQAREVRRIRRKSP